LTQFRTRKIIITDCILFAGGAGAFGRFTAKSLRDAHCDVPLVIGNAQTFALCPEGGMIFGEPPPFDAIIQEIAERE
jgi:hypothetical protein